uniref:Uncharacterized protein n=1 Tax=Romanomermis culicivorax TaxID=13658 RepID=A0A915HQT7_ROMCU
MNNWTVANMGDLILSSGYFDNLPFNREKSVDRLREKLALSLASKRASNLTHEKTKLIAKQFVSIMIKKQSCDSNCSMCGEDNGRGASTTGGILGLEYSTAVELAVIKL